MSGDGGTGLQHDEPADVGWARWRRLAALLAAGLVGGLLAVGFLILPPLLGLLPWTVRKHPVEWSALGLLALYGALRVGAAVPWDGRLITRLRWALARLDGLSRRALRGGLAAAVGLVAAGLLATWAPHYLLWPWCRDNDTFAVLAQSWDAGIRPYRDILGYNFPGQTYLFWALGKTFGWGHTSPLFAFDTVVLVSFGVALASWSRRRLGGALPGLGAYLAFLAFYLGLQYELVAQRDWYTALSVALALFVLQARPGRAGRLLSAAATASALTFRPHAVLFLPALASAIDENARRPGEPITWALRALIEWGLATSLFLLLFFAPVIADGLLDDLARGLRIVAYGGPYSQATPSGILVAFAAEFDNPLTDVLLTSTLLLTLVGPPDRRRLARTWAFAWLGALAYGPIHPIQHAYLTHPLALVRSVSLAMPLAFVRDLTPMARPLRVLALALILYEVLPEIPRFCSVVESLDTLGPLVRGEEPPEPPLGCLQAFPRAALPPRGWDNYVAALAYLRRTVRPTTLIANALNRYPYESFNGTTGRLSPFRAESGVCWMVFVRIDLDAAFAAELESSPDSVAVWDPLRRRADPRIRLPRVFAVIRDRYEPEARFGDIEVWRRKPARAGGPRSPTSPADLPPPSGMASSPRTK